MTAETVAAVRPRRISDRVRIAQEYRLYLAAQYDAAEAACMGILVNADGARRGVSPRTTWFGGRNGTLRYASDELADWFEVYGRPLTAAEWRMWQAPSAAAEPVDVVTDAAGVRHAVAYREWAGVAYTVCEAWCDPAVAGESSEDECLVCASMLPDVGVVVSVPECVSVSIDETAGDATDVGADGIGVPVTVVGPVEGQRRACGCCGAVSSVVTVAGPDGVAWWCVGCAARVMGVSRIWVRLLAAKVGGSAVRLIPDLVPA